MGNFEKSCEFLVWKFENFYRKNFYVAENNPEKFVNCGINFTLLQKNPI